MDGQIFTGGLDELRGRLIELWELTEAGAKPGWLAREEFLPEARIPEGWKPTRPPGDAEWIIAAENFAQVLDGWRWLLKSDVWRGVPGVSPAVLWEMIDSAASLMRLAAGTAARGGDFDSAIGDLAEGMRRAKDIVSGKASELLAAIKVAAQRGGDAPAMKSSPQAFSADRERWEFARPLREKGLRWKTIAEQWRKQEADPIDAKGFEISCGRAKRAESRRTER